MLVQATVPYFLRISSCRDFISALLQETKQERNHESVTSRTEPRRRSSSSRLPPRLGSSMLAALLRALRLLASLQALPLRAGTSGWIHTTITVLHPQIPAGTELAVQTTADSRRGCSTVQLAQQWVSRHRATWPHLSSWRTRLRSRSRAARSSSLSGLEQKKNSPSAHTDPRCSSPHLHLRDSGRTVNGPPRYLLFALLLTTAAAADKQHDEDHSTHHRHGDDQGFKIHCKMQQNTLAHQCTAAC